jgi:hypothetical protein
MLVARVGDCERRVGLAAMLFSVRFAAEIDDTKELRESASSAWETLLDALPRVGIADGVLG